ncbi:conserved protein, unknown function, partial [Hepatocystis sp. ex Piliocolobus tephrosceles]
MKNKISCNKMLLTQEKQNGKNDKNDIFMLKRKSISNNKKLINIFHFELNKKNDKCENVTYLYPLESKKSLNTRIDIESSNLCHEVVPNVKEIITYTQVSHKAIEKVENVPNTTHITVNVGEKVGEKVGENVGEKVGEKVG